MADTTWVVVADGSRARFFETPGLKLDLREIEDLINIVPSRPALSEKDREKLAKTVADRVEQERLHQPDRAALTHGARRIWSIVGH